MEVILLKRIDYLTAKNKYTNPNYIVVVQLLKQFDFS